jgi:hypothetical protein
VQLLSDSVTISLDNIIAWDTIIIGNSTYFPGDTLSKGYTFTDFVDVNRHIGIFNALMRNEQFRQYYISRYHDLMKTVFSRENMLRELDAVVNSIAPEMPAHIRRWGGSMQEWTANVKRLRDYIIRRSDYLTAGLKDCYQLTGPYPITIETEGATNPVLEINSLTVDKFPYNNSYFGNLGIAVSANPNDPKLELKRWSASSQIPFKVAAPGSAVFFPKSAGSVSAIFGPKTLNDNEHSDSNSPDDIVVYPTLFEERLFVNCAKTSNDKISVRMLDLKGRQLASYTLTCADIAAGHCIFSIDLSDLRLPSGLYLLDINTGRKQQLKKVVKS